VLASVLILLTGLRLYQSHWGPDPECVRKLMHLGGGLLACMLPTLFDSAEPVLLLCTATFLGLLALRYLPSLKRGIGKVISCVDRRSGGDLCFPVAVGLVYFDAGGDLILYLLPLLILTFADPAAALVGSRYGFTRFGLSPRAKSLEGSVVFFVVSFLTAHVTLSWVGDAGGAEAFLVSVLLSLLLTVVEAATGGGFDNFLIPVCGLFLLRMLLPMESGPLALWLVVSGAAVTPFLFRLVNDARDERPRRRHAL
jgi:phytol kinase